jgi:hypothetical protein
MEGKVRTRYIGLIGEKQFVYVPVKEEGMMFRKLNPLTTKVFLFAVLATLLAGTAALGLPGQGKAHCDSRQGPVVAAAQQALDTGQVKIVLPYVKPEDEAELTAAFQQAREVRKTGPKAKEMADNYFFEVAVRLHRQGEGAPYTGLKNEPVPPAIQAADGALENGSLDGVNRLLTQAISKGLKEKYEAVEKARLAAEKEGSVEAHRELVEAELGFEKYVYELYGSATAANPHAEGQH